MRTKYKITETLVQDLKFRFEYVLELVRLIRANEELYEERQRRRIPISDDIMVNLRLQIRDQNDELCNHLKVINDRTTVRREYRTPRKPVQPAYQLASGNGFYHIIPVVQVYAKT